MEGNTHHVVLNRPSQQNILPCTASNNTQLCMPNSNSNVSNSASRRINYHKWEEDERLGGQSTIAPVLHANISHPTLRGQYPEFTVRAKEISKLWRRLSSEERGTWVVSIVLILGSVLVHVYLHFVIIFSLTSVSSNQLYLFALMSDTSS